MKNIFLLLTVFFLVEYESYTWIPCNGTTCFAVSCPVGGCKIPAEEFFVKTISEATEIVNQNGVEHLLGVYRVKYDGNTKEAEVKKLEVVPNFKIEIGEPEVQSDDLIFQGSTLLLDGDALLVQ